MSNPNPPFAAALSSRVAGWIALAALACYALVLGWNFSPYAGGADSSGYLNSARLLAAGTLAAEPRIPAEFGPDERVIRQHFQPHGFVPFDGNPKLSPTYPVGVPLHLALAGRLVGWTAAPYLVGLATALATLGLMYAVGRQLGLPPILAGTGAAIMAVYPVFVFMSLQPLSDTPATAWSLAAVWAALRARDRSGWAAACGAALAVAVLVRATNLLLLPALVVLLGLDGRRLALAFLGGLPGALWLGYYQHALYGSAFRSGYVDITQAFGWAYGWPTALHFAQWLALLLPAALLVLPAWLRRRGPARTREALALALWFGTFAGFYSFYEISHEVWWNLRFLLPGTPALIFAGLLGLEALARDRTPDTARRLRLGAALGLTLWAVALGGYWTHRFHLLLTKTYERAYADTAAAARARFAPGTLVVAGLQSGTLLYYTDLPLLRWEFVRPEQFNQFLSRTRQAGRPVGAVLHQIEEAEALQKNCPGAWTRLATVRDFSLWQLDAGAPVSAR
ncbi:MAG: glycosyltransferase family 39 protein [Opitutaceae bacterium]|nr:glycosyltransferase family 39 protein [Opitutaceae bacterium]